MRFALLASGSKGNCFILEDQDTCIMIDCGTTRKYLAESFSKIGLRDEEIDAVLITHNHSDHISQIRNFKHHTIYSPVLIDDVKTNLVKPNTSFQINHLTITPLALSHDAPNTVGYIIEDGKEKLVYVTDTGYVNSNYYTRMKDADYIVLESNHDTEMLMRTSRPQFIKARIFSDQGHLCNEDAAEVLDTIISEKTKFVILAHISQEGNTQEKALEVSRNILLQHEGELHPDLMLCAAGQYEIIRKGSQNEEVDVGRISCPIGLERHANISNLSKTK